MNLSGVYSEQDKSVTQTRADAHNSWLFIFAKNHEHLNYFHLFLFAFTALYISFFLSAAIGSLILWLIDWLCDRYLLVSFVLT